MVEQTEETVLENTLCVEAEEDHQKDAEGQEAVDAVCADSREEAEEVVSRDDENAMQLG